MRQSKFDLMSKSEKIDFYLAKKPSYRECFSESDLGLDPMPFFYLPTLGGRVVIMDEKDIKGFDTKKEAIDMATRFQAHMKTLKNDV